MKKLAIIIALALLATSSMYPMEPAKDMTVKTPEEKKFQPKLLKDLALSKVIMNNVQPALDQLTIETFHDVRDALLTFCNESKSIGDVPIEHIIKIDSKEEIPYKILALIMKAYNAPDPRIPTNESNIKEIIRDFLIYVLYKNMPQREKNKHFPKGPIYIKYLDDYRDLFIYAYLGSIVDQLTARNIDAIYEEIRKLEICTDEEKLATLRKSDLKLSAYRFPELVKIATVGDCLILKSLKFFSDEESQFLNDIKSAHYLKAASLHKTAEKLRQDYQAITDSACFLVIQPRLHQKNKDTLTKIGTLLSKNIYAIKYELDTKPWLQKAGQRLKQIGASIQKEALDEATQIALDYTIGVSVGSTSVAALVSFLDNKQLISSKFMPLSLALYIGGYMGGACGLLKGIIVNCSSIFIDMHYIDHDTRKELIKNVLGTGVRLGILYGAHKLLWKYATDTSVYSY